MITVTDDQLRSILQLPARPYSDTFAYDGSPYFDLQRREIVNLLGVSGTVASASTAFRLGVDFQLTAGSIDWTLAGRKPDFGTAFTVEYSYSRLGAAAASTATFFAPMIVTQDLGPAFPYGQNTTSGIPFNNLALMGQMYVAAREACNSLANAEIDIAEKYRRGSVLVDDTKKSADWITTAGEWDTKYKRYLTLIRPGGQVRGFSAINANAMELVFSADFGNFRLVGDQVYDGFFGATL